MLDVAKRAGVSRTTVSFVLNERGEERGIPASTIERVRESVRELGYQPDRAARMLRSGRSDLVLFAAPALSDLGPSALRLVSAVGAELEAAGLHLVTRRMTAGRPLHELWRGLSPAAVLGLDIDDQDLADLQAASTPAVDLDVAGFDEEVGALQARHLIERSHQHLAYAGSASAHSTTCSQRRLDGVRLACRQAGVPTPVAVSLGVDVDSAVAAVRELRGHPSVTAICAYDDDHAFALLAGMAELGLRAPRDYALIGADNTPLSAVAVPPLTTVDHDVEATARFLSGIVVGAVSGANGPDLLDGPSPRVVVRRTG